MALHNCEFARKLHDLLAASEGGTLEPWQCWIDTFVFESPMSLSIQQERRRRRCFRSLRRKSMSGGIASAGCMRSFEAKPPTTPSKRRLNNSALALIHRNELKARKARGRPLLARVG